MLCILAIDMIVLTLLTSVVLYEFFTFLTAAYDVVSCWVQNLKWKRRNARRRRK